MRLNEKNYKSYTDFYNKSSLMYEVDEVLVDKITLPELGEHLGRMYRLFATVKDRYYLTDTFNDALQKANDKVKDLLRSGKAEFSKSSHYASCILMHRNGWLMHGHYSDGKGDMFCVVYVFSRNALVGVGQVPVNRELKKDENIGHLAVPKGFGVSTDIAMASIMGNYNIALYFIGECEIEIKDIEPKGKARINGQKYYNEENRSAIKVLDCRWFTELHIDTPFHVNGHYRWQPCGVGRTKRRFVYIEPFEKTGYHRKATKAAN